MSGPIAVVTGAASGIGAACVDEFRAVGYHTIGVDLATGSKAEEHLRVDLASPACGSEVAAFVGERAVAVLVNNAAIPADLPLSETTLEAWDRTMAVNLRAPFLLSVALLSALRAEGGGVVVNVSSVHSLATAPGAAAYAASKGGLTALTRSMAVEWGPEMRVNAVLPGAAETPMLDSGLQRSGQTAAQIGDRLALGRVATPAEIARVIRFVAMEATFMTGSAVVVDGGARARLSSE